MKENFAGNERKEKSRGKGAVRLYDEETPRMRGGDEDIPQPKQSITILNTRGHIQ